MSTRKPPEKPLEVEIPEPLQAKPETESKRQAMAKEIRERDAHWQATSRAMEENRSIAGPSLSAIAWKSFLGLGAVSAVYFFSLAFTDPTNFREGAGIFWRLAWQLAATAAVWLAGLWVYQRSAPEYQQRLRVGFLHSCLALLLVGVMFSFGVFWKPGRGVWGGAAFLFSFALEVSALIFLWQLRKRLVEQIKHGEILPGWIRPLLYACEGVMLYLAVGIFLQGVLHIHVPAIVGMVVRSPKLLLLFSVPFFGYLGLRKMVGEL